MSISETDIAFQARENNIVIATEKARICELQALRLRLKDTILEIDQRIGLRERALSEAIRNSLEMDECSDKGGE